MAGKVGIGNGTNAGQMPTRKRFAASTSLRMDDAVPRLRACGGVRLLKEQ